MKQLKKTPSLKKLMIIFLSVLPLSDSLAMLQNHVDQNQKEKNPLKLTESDLKNSPIGGNKRSFGSNKYFQEVVESIKVIKKLEIDLSELSKKFEQITPEKTEKAQEREKLGRAMMELSERIRILKLITVQKRAIMIEDKDLENGKTISELQKERTFLYNTITSLHEKIESLPMTTKDENKNKKKKRINSEKKLLELEGEIAKKCEECFEETKAKKLYDQKELESLEFEDENSTIGNDSDEKKMEATKRAYELVKANISPLYGELRDKMEQDIAQLEEEAENRIKRLEAVMLKAKKSGIIFEKCKKEIQRIQEDLDKKKAELQKELKKNMDVEYNKLEAKVSGKSTTASSKQAKKPFSNFSNSNLIINDTPKNNNPENKDEEQPIKLDIPNLGIEFNSDNNFLNEMNDQGVSYALVNNLKKACKYFRKAAEKGHKGALLNLTHALFELSKTDKSNESKLFGELLRWITKAANDGIPEAQYNFAYVFYQKSGGENPEELETVITLLKKAAQQDYAPATYILGIFYITGRGAKKDILGGVTLLKRAAAGGHEPAIAALKTLDLEAELKKLKSKKLNKTQQNKDKK